MKTVVFKKQKVIALAASYVCVLLEGKKIRALQRKLKMTGTPSYAVLDTQGKAIDTFVGATDDSRIIRMLEPPLEKAVAAAEKALAHARELLAAKEYLRAYKALARLAGRLTWSEPSKAAAKEVAGIRADAKVWPTVEAGLQEEQAKVLVSRADEHLVAQRYAEALALLDEAARKYPRSPSGKAAGRKAQQMRTDPATMKAIRAAAQLKKARAWWNLANSFLRNGLTDKAKGYLKRIVEKCADTKYAQMAKEKLEELD